MEKKKIKNEIMEQLDEAKKGYLKLYSFKDLDLKENAVMSYYIDCISNERIQRNGKWMRLCRRGFVDNYIKINNTTLFNINKKLKSLGYIECDVKNGIGTFVKVNKEKVLQNCLSGPSQKQEAETYIPSQNCEAEYSDTPTASQNCEATFTEIGSYLPKNRKLPSQNCEHSNLNSNLNIQTLHSNLTTLEGPPTVSLQEPIGSKCEQSSLNKEWVKEMVKVKYPSITHEKNINFVSEKLVKHFNKESEVENFFNGFTNPKEMMIKALGF